MPVNFRKIIMLCFRFESYFVDIFRELLFIGDVDFCIVLLANGQDEQEQYFANNEKKICCVKKKLYFCSLILKSVSEF